MTQPRGDCCARYGGLGEPRRWQRRGLQPRAPRHRRQADRRHPQAHHQALQAAPKAPARLRRGLLARALQRRRRGPSEAPGDGLVRDAVPPGRGRVPAQARRRALRPVEGIVREPRQGEGGDTLERRRDGRSRRVPQQGRRGVERPLRRHVDDPLPVSLPGPHARRAPGER